MMLHIVGSTTFFVTVVNTLLAGALGALVGALATDRPWVVAAAGVVTAALWFWLQVDLTRRLFAPPSLDVRFPSVDEPGRWG